MKKIFSFAILSLFLFSIVLEAQELSITIDAQKDAFYSTLTGPENGYIRLPYLCFLPATGISPENDADCSGYAWFAYDEDYLYCYIEVTDNIVTASNASRFENDCVELKFDPDPAAGAGTATSNSRLTALGADDAEDPAGVDNLNGSGHLEDAEGNDLVVTEADYARRLLDNGYVLEFRIPFTYINEKEDERFMVNRDVNNVFGMAVNICDNDATARESILQWSAGLSNDAHSNASLLGSVTFLEGNKVKLEAVSPRDPSIINANAAAWYTPTPQEFAITIDAQKDAFYNSLTGYENGVVGLPQRCYLPDVGTPPDNDDDCSGTAWFSYDEDYLYCYIEVRDNIVTASNANRFENDCVELKFDPDPAAGAGTATSNSRMTALGVDTAEDPAGVDNLNGSGHLEDADGNDLVVTEADYARRLTDDGYALEFRIPFTYINEKEDERFMVNRDVNNVFGMAINICDNDATARESALQWSAGHSNNAHSNASLLGSVTFLEGNKVKLSAISPRDPSVFNANEEDWYTPELTSVTEEPGVVKSFNLSQNYPNPFNPSTTIQFSVPENSFVSLKIYNAVGQMVAELVSEELHTGIYSTVWNATDFASGIYYYQLVAGNTLETKKLVLLK